MSEVSWEQARELTFSAAQRNRRRATENLALADAIGATLAVAALAPISLPHYASSAMDGFAVAGSSPWQLVRPPEAENSHENIHKRTVALSKGQATPILTGGLLPAGADAVVRVEYSYPWVKTPHRGQIFARQAKKSAPVNFWCRPARCCRPAI